MKSLAFLLLLLGSFGCATRTVPTPGVDDVEDPRTATLTVELVVLESDGGEVAVALYDSADAFEERSGAVATVWIEPHDGRASWSVEGLPPGAYAVAAYQDLNGNRRLDRRALGPPSEPYGFSNDARGAFGPPAFEKAAIDIGPGIVSIEITLR